MNPAILIGAAGLLLVASGGKKSSKKKGSGGGGGTDPGPVTGKLVITGSAPKVGKPWDACEPPPGSSSKTYAAYGKDGKCMVFWDESAWDTARAYIDAELAKLTEEERAAMCSADNCVPDPYAVDPELFCEWTESPERIDFLRSVISKMYPQLKDYNFPPEPARGPGTGAQYFPAMVWKFVQGTFTYEYCGFHPVT